LSPVRSSGGNRTGPHPDGAEAAPLTEKSNGPHFVRFIEQNIDQNAREYATFTRKCGGALQEFVASFVSRDLSDFMHVFHFVLSLCMLFLNSNTNQGKFLTWGTKGEYLYLYSYRKTFVETFHNFSRYSALRFTGCLDKVTM
jgi:hypothetical protein